MNYINHLLRGNNIIPKLNKLYISLWNRNVKEKKKYDYADILSYIVKEMSKKGEKIIKDQYQGDSWGNYYIIKEIDFSGDFDLAKVSKWIYMLYKIIIEYSNNYK